MSLLQRRFAMRTAHVIGYKPAPCQLHQIPLKFFCHDCNQLACADCLLDDHASHHYEYATKVASKQLTSLQATTKTLNDASQDYKVALTAIKNRKDEIVRQSEEISRTVNETFDEIRKATEETRETLLRKTEELTRAKVTSLYAQRDEIADVHNDLNEILETIEGLITEPSRHTDLMTSFRSLIATVYQHMQKHATARLIPSEIPDLIVDVTCAEQIKTICKTHPQVYASSVSGPGTHSAEVGTPATIFVRSDTENPAIRVLLRSLSDQSTVLGMVSNKCYVNLHEAIYTPTKRGCHSLDIEINGNPVRCSPCSVFVGMPPTLIRNSVAVIKDLDCPTGIAFTSKGDMVVAEWGANVVSVRDAKGRKLSELRGHVFERPFGVAVDEEDSIYVSEESANRISKFTREGLFVASAGSAGSRAGEFNSPRGLRVIGGKLYVCDRENNRVQVFDRNLRSLECVGGEDVAYKWATDLTSTPAGRLYIAGTEISDVNVIELGGGVSTTVHHFRLLCPTGICFDPSHTFLYVVDYNYHSVFVFNREGDFLARFGSEGTENGELKFPRGIAADKDGYLYVCDTQNNRIQVF